VRRVRPLATKTFAVQENETITQALRRHRKLLTVSELSDALSIATKTLYARAKAGTVPTVHLFGSLRFDPVVIARWLEDRAA
jgi:hypothetical protein